MTLEDIEKEMRTRMTEDANVTRVVFIPAWADALKAEWERVKDVQARAERCAKAEAAPGGVLVEGDEYVRVTFEEKPSRDLLDALRAAGVWWKGGSWSGKRADLPPAVVQSVRP